MQNDTAFEHCPPYSSGEGPYTAQDVEALEEMRSLTRILLDMLSPRAAPT